ncbi:MAG: hypothetical protein U0031_23615, partial [Thermomicrobiales bacterium]
MVPVNRDGVAPESSRFHDPADALPAITPAIREPNAVGTDLPSASEMSHQLLEDPTHRRGALRSLGAISAALLAALGLNDAAGQNTSKKSSDKGKGKHKPRNNGKHRQNGDSGELDKDSNGNGNGGSGKKNDGGASGAAATPTAGDSGTGSTGASNGRADARAAGQNQNQNKGGKTKKKHHGRQHVGSAAIPATCCGTKACSAPSNAGDWSNCNYAGQTINSDAINSNFKKIDGRNVRFQASVRGGNFTNA